MGKNSWFQFKQFRIEQQHAPMKVGTDGVLLGAWTNIENTTNVLDVGTGTGLIALMLVQRSTAKIDAIEIHQLAANDARANFYSSPWRERLTLFCDDFISFSSETKKRYDLIVSNPPFFVNSMKNVDPDLAIARHADNLSFQQLIVGAKDLLKPDGRLSVIVPSESFDGFRESARLSGLYLQRQTNIFPMPEKPRKRIMLEFSLLPCYPKIDNLFIHMHKQEYSREFIELTRDFYLGM